MPRVLRPIETDRARLEDFAANTGTVLGVAAETHFFLFVVDLVRPADRSPFPYSRLINLGQLKGGTNVAVLAIVRGANVGEQEKVILVEQERHATGHIELAIPRGFGEPAQNGATAALRELREETGCIGSEAEFLGESVIDSGAGDARVSFFRIAVASRGQSAPEAHEAITGHKIIPLSELRQMIASGEVKDAFTLQALALADLRDGRLPATENKSR